MEIPIQLKKRGINFVLVESKGKKPFQLEWQNKIIEFDNQELLRHISNGGNYGIRGGGKNNLIIIDFDDEKVQEEVCKKLPPTFTVKTGSGKLHKYFFTDKVESFKIFDEDMNTLVDIQGEGKQVIGAGSVHPNGNKYEVEEDLEISKISLGEIKALLEPYNKKPQKKEEKKEEYIRIDVEDNFLDKIKSVLSMEEVLKSFGIDTSKNPTECPFHSSKGGKCLGFKKEVAHCFHCDGSWNIFSFVKDIKKYDFKESLEYLANLAGMADELQVSRQKYINAIKEKNTDEKKEVKDSFLDLIKEKKWGDAAELLVDYVKRNNYIYTTKDDTKSEIWIYEDGIYVPQGKSHVKEVLRNVLGKWYNIWMFNQVINKLEPDTFIETQDFFKQEHKTEIPLLNGILDIEKRELKEFSPEKIFFNKMPVEYNPNADCPNIENFLKDVLSNEQDIDVFYELGGFCLLKEYKFEKAFMLVGNGRNGKDKTLELIKRVIGVKNCCSVPLSSIKPDTFVISEFFGKMVNMAGDIDNRDLKDTSMFKALTGRSIVSAPRKFLNAITFQNYAKFIFACNDLPMVYDTSKGFWDRWVLLEFPYTFVTKEDIAKEQNNELLKIRDEDIIEKIATPSELSGLLNKFLDGYDRLCVSKSFSSTKGTEDIKNLWIRKSNSFMAFCMDKLTDDYDKWITKKELRKKYTQYCKKHKIPVKSDYVMKRTLEELWGIVEGHRQVLDKWERVWEGIKWR